MHPADDDWAVFWCSLLSPVLLGEIPEAQRERYFQELSRQERRLPNGQRRCISARTFRRKWRYYLASCEAAFREHVIGDIQLVLTRAGNRRLGGIGRV